MNADRTKREYRKAQKYGIRSGCGRESEDDFIKGQEGEPKWASQSFVPSGLFNPGEGDDPNPPEALGLFAGIIKQTEKKKNEFK